MSVIPAEPEMLRVASVSSDNRIGVDRESNVIRGYAVAEEGATKTPGRGEFDLTSLQMLMDLGNAEPKGVRMRFQHPSASDDGLGKYLGRARNFRVDEREGRAVLRADAHLDPTSLKAPPGGGEPRGKYLMDLAESDPGAFQSSIVIPSADKLDRDPDSSGKRMAPLYRPTKFFASDFVDEGDAVHGDLFSADVLDEFFEGSDRRMPTKLAAAGAQYLDQCFPEMNRDEITSRFSRFLTRYLDSRFGSAEISDDPTVESFSMDPETKDALSALKTEFQQTTAAIQEQFSKLNQSLDEDRKERKAELSSQKRAEEIASICTLAGMADKSASYIANDNHSPDSVRSELFALVCSRNAPPADDPAAEDGFSSGGDKNTKFREEYAEHKQVHDALGISEKRYIAKRRQEEGLPEEAAA